MGSHFLLVARYDIISGYFLSFLLSLAAFVGNLQHFSILCLSIGRPNNNQNKRRSTFDFIFARWQNNKTVETSKDAAVLANLAANRERITPPNAMPNRFEF